MTHRLSPHDQRFLLELARASLHAHLAGESLCDPESPPPAVIEPRGAFVTLTRDATLRGCIGHIQALHPLWESVRSNAIAAATCDPRFEPVSREELEALSIEISALTPLTQVTDVSMITVGVHGIMVDNGLCRGLLLPQVALEYGWSREEFLDHTCRKAGLQPGCWRHPDVTISAFAAEVFSEQ